MATLSRNRFQQRVLGIAALGFLCAVTAALWTSPLAGFMISILVGILAVGLREVHTKSPKYHLATVRLFQAVTALGSLIVFVGFFITHHPLSLVGYIGLLVTEWIVLFFA